VIVLIATAFPALISALMAAWKTWLSRRDKVSVVVDVDDQRFEVSGANPVRVQELLRALDAAGGNKGSTASGAGEVD